MKKYIFGLLLALGVASCDIVDVLDKKPAFEADLEGAITNPETVELALNGIYYNLPGNGFNVIFPTTGGPFKAGTLRRQEFTGEVGNTIYYSERYYPTLSYSDTYEWDDDYSIIKNANYLEEALNGIDAGAFEGNRKEEVLGEIYYLRAFAYFRLLVRYGEYWDETSPYGVIIRNENPSVENAKKPRATVAASYEEILRQVEVAIEKAPEWSNSAQASKQAARALKAKALFYSGKYQEAIQAIDEAVDTNQNLPEANYGDIFDKFTTSEEILFARFYDQNDAANTSTRETAYGNSTLKNQGYWGPSKEYVALVGDDPRAQAIFSNVDSLEYRGTTAYNLKSVKKFLNAANNMPIIFSRVAELYLMKAEALYRTGASISTAYAPIEKIRQRAGATIQVPTTTEELEDAIFNEWMIEMSFENWHEWFTQLRFAGFTERPDFTRLFQLNTTLKENYDEECEASASQGEAYYQRIIDRRIEAIPSSERNSNELAEQNPGY